MKVLLLGESDINGGAARGMYRLHQGLQSAGVESSLLVRDRRSTDPFVVAHKTILTKLGPPLNNLALKRYPQTQTLFSAQWFPDDLLPAVRQINPDLVNINWVCNGYLRIETIAQFNKPLIWTLHDMWPMTGGCNYNEGCDRYQHTCGNCPQLFSQRESDLSRWIWRRKARAWKNLNLSLVAPSRWIAQCAAESSLFKDRRIDVIHGGLDTHTYRPIPQQTARELLNLPQNKHLVLFGAPGAVTDKRKGFQLLLPALQNLSQAGWGDRLEVVVFGASQSESSARLSFKAHYLGKLSDDITLALAYSAADVMVVPSLQESFGQTASESLACGTPVVAFNATGLRDIVDHQQNGYLAKPFEVDDLAQGIAWVLGDDDRRQVLSQSAREKAVRSFSVALQADRYQSLFHEIGRLNSP
ncbi:MAG: glycosyltransferase [Leptolyngbyaceae cyanobacterium CSU_1_3]|nr:glycosyltransferase [Leptolyngbyaceae cyanobacterium CSU_1_3]